MSNYDSFDAELEFREDLYQKRMEEFLKIHTDNPDGSTIYLGPVIFNRMKTAIAGLNDSAQWKDLAEARENYRWYDRIWVLDVTLDPEDVVVLMLERGANG